MGMRTQDYKIIQYCRNLYTEEEFLPFLEGIDWTPIGRQNREKMERLFEMKEIRRVVWELGKDKTPRPDEYTLELFKVCWDILKANLFRSFI